MKTYAFFLLFLPIIDLRTTDLESLSALERVKERFFDLIVPHKVDNHIIFTALVALVVKTNVLLDAQASHQIIKSERGVEWKWTAITSPIMAEVALLHVRGLVANSGNVESLCEIKVVFGKEFLPVLVIENVEG